MRTTEDPLGSVNVSTFEVDVDGVENTLDVIDIGSTVNVGVGTLSLKNTKMNVSAAAQQKTLRGITMGIKRKSTSSQWLSIRSRRRRS